MRGGGGPVRPFSSKTPRRGEHLACSESDPLTYLEGAVIGGSPICAKSDALCDLTTGGVRCKAGSVRAGSRLALHLTSGRPSGSLRMLTCHAGGYAFGASARGRPGGECRWSGCD